MGTRSGAGEAFHEATRYAAPGGTLAHPSAKGPTAATRRKLPSPRRQSGPGIWEAIAQRESIRRYGNDALTLEALSQLLWVAGGETGRRDGPFRFRTVPSAGALYPLDTYAVCRKVDGLAPGIYRHVPRGHELDPVREGDASGELAAAALGQGMVAAAAACLVWTGVVERTTAKYADRGYRYVYMEAGIASENVHLAATALGLGSCAVGAFCDDAVDALLGIDGREEIALLIQCVGARRS
jgi:SagB-type dehydrogenase family enzyme